MTAPSVTWGIDGDKMFGFRRRWSEEKIWRKVAVDGGGMVSYMYSRGKKSDWVTCLSSCGGTIRWLVALGFSTLGSNS